MKNPIMTPGTLIDDVLRISRELQITLESVSFDPSGQEVIFFKWTCGGVFWRTGITAEDIAVHRDKVAMLYCGRAHHALTRGHLNKHREQLGPS